MPRPPRLQLTAAFREALRNDPRGIVRLANLAGFPAYTSMARLTKPKRFAGTTLAQARLRQLACVMAFTGDIWHS
jgi:hypothetical protein